MSKKKEKKKPSPEKHHSQIQSKQQKIRDRILQYYKVVSRIVEYYVVLCFILISFVPLLNYSWVPSFTRFIYFTGFPLLIILLIVSSMKDSFINFLVKLATKSQGARA